MPFTDRPFDLPPLRAALAVRETGSVTRAADHLALSQPAVSRLLGALEAELGFQIFERRAKRMVLTERGRQFLDEGQSAMRGMARLVVLAGELRHGSHGLLRIGAISPLAFGLVAQAVAAHRRAWPRITVEIDVLRRQPLFAELRAGRIDIGLAAMPFADEDLHVEPVMAADAVCLLRADHALAGRAVLQPADLADEALVISRPEAIIRQRIDDAFRQAGVAQRVAAIAHSMPVAVALVAQGVGIAIVHAWPPDALPPGIVARRFHPRLSFEYALITQSESGRAAAVIQFGEILHRVARSFRRTLRPSGPSSTGPASR